MFWEKEGITEEQANEIVSLCIENAILKGVNFEKCTPVGNNKSFVESLRFFRGEWFIEYNDESGSSKVAKWNLTQL